MNLEPDPSEADFRAKLRSFIAANLPADMAERVRRSAHAARDDVTAWMRILHKKGWAAVGWPTEYGGPGWGATRRILFEEECLYADAPPQHFANIHSVGPVIYTFGDEAQKRQHLEPLLKGDVIWCQGFSEPNAGSDLASLTTRAVQDGDHYVVNGQKIWTSDAHEADWMFALVRTNTDGAPQRGISFLLIDMKTPGITVRPITLIDGAHPVSEVIFDNVRVPVANRVNEEGKGWTIAKFLLANERAFSAEVPCTKRDMTRLIAFAKAKNKTGAAPWDDPLLRAKIVELQADLDALEFTVMRAILADDHGASNLASLVKIPGSEMRQRVSELMVEVLSTYGATYYPAYYSEKDRDTLPGPIEARGVSGTFAYRRATTIYGGANEVQRDIISKAILRL